MEKLQSSQIFESLCLRCSATPAAAERAEESCFLLEPQGVTSGYPETFERLQHTNESMAVITTFDGETGGQSDLSGRLTHDGQPVTTQTIQHLCGGQAPHIWREKMAQISAQSETLGPIDGVMIVTAEGDMYDFDPLAARMVNAGTRLYIPGNLAGTESIREELGLFYRYWLHIQDGIMCPSAPGGRLEDQLLVASQEQRETWDPNAVWVDLAAPRCDAPRALTPTEWKMVEKGEALVETAFRDVAKIYLAAEDPPVTISFCPVVTKQAYAQYNSETHAIQFFLDFFLTPEFQGATQRERKMMVGVIVAHEVGHHRHNAAAGLYETTVHALTSIYNLPVTIAGVLDILLPEWGLPERCWESFVRTLSGNGTMEAPPGHAPGHAEIVADIYSLDYILRRGKSRRKPSKAFARFLKDHDLRRQENARRLLTDYSHFPQASAELLTLHAAINWDPRLLRRTQRISTAHVVWMGALLPPGVERHWVFPPLRAVGAAEQASLTRQEQRRLQQEPLYIDLVSAFHAKLAKQRGGAE
jgi:hypothetical protein